MDYSSQKFCSLPELVSPPRIRPGHHEELLLPKVLPLVEYAPVSSIPHLLTDPNRNLMAMIRFDQKAFASPSSFPLFISVGMAQLGMEEFVEIWSSSTPVQFDRSGNIRSARNGDFVLGYYEWHVSDESRVERVVQEAYEELLSYCEVSGFRHLLRIWNYFPSINRERNGLDRYKRFCIGRHQAFAACFTDFPAVLPAASAVGTIKGPFQVIFLAGTQQGWHVENPRQVSAYKYPQIYGPKSPSFARGTLVGFSANPSHLLVAGTASIVGHASQHLNDPVQQTHETLTNIQAVLQACQTFYGLHICSREGLGLLKVYVRREADFEEIRDEISASWCGNYPVVYLLGEMCRQELRIEIEAILEISH